MARTLEQIRAAKRLHMAKRRADDPDAVRKYQREAHHRNRDRNTAKMRDYYARRFFWGRAMKLRSSERATYTELAAIWKKQRGCCGLTGERLTRLNSHLDHIIPKTRGGSDKANNLRWVTKEANLLKRDLTDAELFQFCSNVMRWIGHGIREVDEILHREQSE